ncbi:MAG: bifunctional nuclease family protein [Thermodesulfobacteriota bacterium]
MFLQMKVHTITVDPFTNVPIVLLKDLEEKKTLPIWIGVLEASAIATQLENLSFSRPMTHDLLHRILERAELDVTKIEITDLKSNVFYASIHISSGENSFLIDARPSDAIALALRTGSPIMVEESVIDKSLSLKTETQKEGEDMDPDKLLEMLDELKIEDLGKYKM